MAEKEVVVAQRACIYVDGGFLADKRISGWGVHGYTYLPEEPKRGTGNPKAVPTDNGYLGAEIVGNKVQIVNYVDISGGSKTLASNNEAELYAFYEGLLWVERQPDLNHAKFWSDSMFVVKGLQHTEAWIAKNWTTAKGTAVKYRPLWEKVVTLYKALSARVEFTVEWIPRDASIGNQLADALASRGLVLGTNDNPDIIEAYRDAQGYWAIKNPIPRIIQAPRWYFMTTDNDFKRDDGSHVYYVGAHGTKDKEDEFFGKRYADNFLGVVRVMNPDPVMEALRQNAISKDPNKRGAIVIGHLDAIFSPKTYKEITDHGPLFLYDNIKRIDLIDSKKVEILVELTPTGLGFRGVQTWESMTKVLDGVIAGDPYFRVTDITDILYEEPEGKKLTRKLKPAVTQITKFLDVHVEFNLEKQKDEPKPFVGKVRLILGGDTLSRNQLAGLSDEVKSVKVVTWRDSDQVGRYATMVELLSGDVGVWARNEANIYYAVKQKPN